MSEWDALDAAYRKNCDDVAKGAVLGFVIAIVLCVAVGLVGWWGRWWW